ncbi:MAG TPA: hypothetical protein DCS43_10100 [Verrucomicrobia bacterium]|nr:hypothetical protein [Verrucomicrobiota bacterium]
MGLIRMKTAVNIEDNASGWSRRYQVALRRYLQTETTASLKAAPQLGRGAVSLGMETLDVARVHELALAALIAGDGSLGISHEPDKRASSFFAEVIVPIEQTHGPARTVDAKVTRLTQSLLRRTKEVTDSTRLLEKGVAQRQTAETALKKSVRNRAELLAEAERLRLHLQKLTLRILSAQEHDRNVTGQHLRDDIAQMLLAIEIRLLALNGAIQINTADLKKEIAETQRIVKQSLATIHRLSL